jgi:hypothetical protein
MPRRLLLVFAMAALPGASALGGMTSYDLSDTARLRLEDISFFLLLLALCSLGIRALWNGFARDFPRLPRLSWGRAAALTALLSLALLLVLSMISGARELLTPQAWRRQGTGYRLNAEASEPQRRQSLEALRVALFAYAREHGGKFPPHDFVPEIPDKLWQSPDGAGTHYIYASGEKAQTGQSMIACEPPAFGDKRFALLADGQIVKLSSDEIRQRLSQP